MHEFARRHNLLRNLIPLWMRKYEVGGLSMRWRRPLDSRDVV
jgi:hypothetical protein